MLLLIEGCGAVPREDTAAAGDRERRVRYCGGGAEDPDDPPERDRRRDQYAPVGVVAARPPARCLPRVRGRGQGEGRRGRASRARSGVRLPATTLAGDARQREPAAVVAARAGG